MTAQVGPFSEDVIHAVRLADVFDAVIQYGVAHRMSDS
jgi:hypothetical protein